MISLIVLFNLFLVPSVCSVIPEQELGPRDWYRIWTSPFGDSVSCNNMILDSDNYIYLTGSVFNLYLHSYDMFLIKYHNTSDASISTSWNSSDYDVSYDMAIDSSNNIYLAGLSGNFSNKHYTLVKFDNNLNYQWNRTWGSYEDIRCYSVAIDSQDNIYLGGSIMQATGYWDICLVKYNISGDLQWFKIWSQYKDDFCFAIAIDSSDNIYLTGKTQGSGYDTKSKLCLLKYNSSGDLQWSRIRDAPRYEIGIGIALDSMDNIFIVGETHSVVTILVKYTKEGIFEWNQTYSGEMYCYSNDIAIDSSDNVYLSGETKIVESSGPSVSVLKYDNNGSLQWHVEWGEPHIEECIAIALDSMHNILIAGEISAHEYQVDGIFIVRNPKTLANPSIINSYSTMLVIVFILLGIVLSIYKILKKKLAIN